MKSGKDTSSHDSSVILVTSGSPRHDHAGTKMVAVAAIEKALEKASIPSTPELIDFISATAYFDSEERETLVNALSGVKRRIGRPSKNEVLRRKRVAQNIDTKIRDRFTDYPKTMELLFDIISGRLKREASRPLKQDYVSKKEAKIKSDTRLLYDHYFRRLNSEPEYLRAAEEEYDRRGSRELALHLATDHINEKYGKSVSPAAIEKFITRLK